QHQQKINDILDREPAGEGQRFTVAPERVPADEYRRPSGGIENQKRHRHHHHQGDRTGGIGLAARAPGGSEQIVQIPNTVQRERHRGEAKQRDQQQGPFEPAGDYQREDSEGLEGEAKSRGHGDFRQREREWRNRQRTKADEMLAVAAKIKRKRPLQKKNQKAQRQREAIIEVHDLSRRQFPALRHEPVEHPSNRDEKSGVDAGEYGGQNQFASRPAGHNEIFPYNRADAAEER